jgi:hypothetical protein
MNLQQVQGQELPPNVKLLEPDSIEAGFYLFSESNSEEGGNSVKPHHVKRYSKDLFVVEISDEIGQKEQFRGKFYSLPKDWKLAPELQSKGFEGTTLLSVHTTDGAKFRKTSEFRLLQQHQNFFVVKVSASEFTSLLDHPLVTHIGKYQKPVIEAPVSFYDLSVNKINLAHYNFPGIEGNGLQVSIKEEFFDTTDIDIRNRFEILGEQNPNVDQHANLIATLIAGGGNTGSKSLGVAPASLVSSYDFVNIFPAPSEYYLSNQIFVENHSYGGAIEAEYGNEAAAYDQIVNEVPELVHVFSSGNSGLLSPETGPYAGADGFANITGNFKMAKNIITVGAVNKEKEILARSSKGPAHDGRVKPELVAYAEIGTSDAAALVSGTVLLIQDLHLDKEGEYPTADLVKAVLVAAAEDVGLPNVDYSSGYGNLDTNKSLEIVESGSYQSGSLSPDQNFTYDLEVPEAAAELKVALSWIDPAAMPGDEVGLINDLDLKITGPDGKVWLPWVLDGTNKETIMKAAIRARDSVNPVELITIENVIPGKYILEVSSKNLSGEQDFSIAYNNTQKSHFTWTFPTGIDAVKVSEETMIRWEESFEEAEAGIEYRYENEDWQVLEELVDLNAEAIKWEVPSRAGLVQLRMTIGHNIFLSDTFTISPELQPEVLFNCEDEVLFAWNKVEGATAYSFQNLGEAYMEQVKILQDTSTTIQKKDLLSPFVSVTPLFGENPGRKGTAINYESQGVECYFQNFFALLGEDSTVTATLNLSTTYNIKKVEFIRRQNGFSRKIATYTAPFSSKGLFIVDNDILFGNYFFSALIHLKSGEVIETDRISIYLPGHNVLLAYPNPVKAGDVLNVISRGDDLDFEVFDMTGQKVFEDQLLRFFDNLELNIPTRGLYIIRATRNGTEVGVQKVIVL